MGNKISHKRALIIGGAGFVGPYLYRELSEYEVHITKLEHETIAPFIEKDKIHNLNILNKEEIKAILQTLQPDIIYHLAAQSSVALSWINPELTIDINIKGSLYLLDSIRESGLNPRIILIGSGEEYGYVKMEEVPIKEENVVRPGNIYAATKVFQNLLGEIYAKAYDMDIISVRAFNHIGAGQLPHFVVADFCKQVADIEKGLQEPVIRVGNLEAARDFTDVRDVVRAYHLLGMDGKQGETYNVGSGKAIKIRYILEKIIGLSKVKIAIEVDEKKLRPVDIPVIEADTNKLREVSGWKPEIGLEETLRSTLNFFRNANGVE